MALRHESEERHESVRFSLTRATQNESNGVLLVHYSFLDFVICKLWVVNASKAVLWKKYKTNNEINAQHVVYKGNCVQYSISSNILSKKNHI